MDACRLLKTNGTRVRWWPGWCTRVAADEFRPHDDRDVTMIISRPLAVSVVRFNVSCAHASLGRTLRGSRTPHTRTRTHRHHVHGGALLGSSHDTKKNVTNETKTQTNMNVDGSSRASDCAAPGATTVARRIDNDQVRVSSPPPRW